MSFTENDLSCSSKYSRKGFPAIGAIGFGRLLITLCSLVPFPPASIIAFIYPTR